LRGYETADTTIGHRQSVKH